MEIEGQNNSNAKGTRLIQGFISYAFNEGNYCLKLLHSTNLRIGFNLIEASTKSEINSVVSPLVSPVLRLLLVVQR
jgi:hypothetical protein